MGAGDTSGRATAAVGLLVVHARVAHLLSVQLRRVHRTMLERAVPSCPGWSLGSLVNHVVGGAERYAMLMEGCASIDVEATRARDYLSADWATLQSQLDRRLVDAFTQCPEGARFPHRAGPVDRVELVRMRVLECLIHGWDIAVSLGGPASLDSRSCDFAVHECAPTIARLASHGFYSPLTTARGEGVCAQLLRAAGRDSSLLIS